MIKYTQEEVDDLLDRNTCEITAQVLELSKLTSEELIDKLLYDFRIECLPFGEYPDYILLEFKNNWINKNL